MRERVLILALLLSACGVKAAPRPPEPRPAAPGQAPAQPEKKP